MVHIMFHSPPLDPLPGFAKMYIVAMIQPTGLVEKMFHIHMAILFTIWCALSRLLFTVIAFFRSTTSQRIWISSGVYPGITKFRIFNRSTHWSISLSINIVKSKYDAMSSQPSELCRRYYTVGQKWKEEIQLDDRDTISIHVFLKNRIEQ